MPVCEAGKLCHEVHILVKDTGVGHEQGEGPKYHICQTGDCDVPERDLREVAEGGVELDMQ